jgi:hypothetical protein
LAGEVGDGAGNSADAVQASAGEAAGAEGTFHQALGGAVEGGDVVEAPGRELGVDRGAAAGSLGSGFGYPGSYGRGRLGRLAGEQVVYLGASDLHPEVEAVDQGA